eukprot:3263200-Pyramimonas_sp.AAC.2
MRLDHPCANAGAILLQQSHHHKQVHSMELYPTESIHAVPAYSEPVLPDCRQSPGQSPQPPVLCSTCAPQQQKPRDSVCVRSTLNVLA